MSEPESKGTGWPVLKSAQEVDADAVRKAPAEPGHQSAGEQAGIRRALAAIDAVGLPTGGVTGRRAEAYRGAFREAVRGLLSDPALVVPVRKARCPETHDGRHLDACIACGKAPE